MSMENRVRVSLDFFRRVRYFRKGYENSRSGEAAGD